MSCLWDVASLDYKNRNTRRDAIHELAIKYGVSDPEMGKKIHNLKSQFRRELKKVKESKKKWGFPFKVRLVWLPTVIIPTPRDGVKKQSKHRL